MTLHFYRLSVLDAVGSQMGFNPPLISRDSPFTRAGRLCLTLLTVGRGSTRPKISCYHLFYRSSVLDAVGSQMGFNPPLISCHHPFYRSSVLDAVGSQMGFNPPLIGTLRDSQKGEEGGPLSWSKAASVYPYTALGIKALERYADCRYKLLLRHNKLGSLENSVGI